MNVFETIIFLVVVAFQRNGLNICGCQYCNVRFRLRLHQEA
mgnify:CR=1 FL=1